LTFYLGGNITDSVEYRDGTSSHDNQGFFKLFDDKLESLGFDICVLEYIEAEAAPTSRNFWQLQWQC